MYEGVIIFFINNKSSIMNSTAMQSALLTPDNHSPEEINELFKSVFSDLNKDVSSLTEKRSRQSST